MKDEVLCEARDLSSLEANFKLAIDEYLAARTEIASSGSGAENDILISIIVR